MDLVSLYVDQPDPPRQADFSRERLARHPEVKGAKTIAEALTLGTGKLAVDGVVLVGEHGNYPAQREGPDQVPALRIFQADRRSLPLQRPQRPRVQRQASLVELGLGEARCTTRRAR